MKGPKCVPPTSIYANPWMSYVWWTYELLHLCSCFKQVPLPPTPESYDLEITTSTHIEFWMLVLVIGWVYSCISDLMYYPNKEHDLIRENGRTRARSSYSVHWSMDFNIFYTCPISSFNFEGKINCGLHLFDVLCGWMAGGWFLNVRSLGVALCAMGKWLELLIWFNPICIKAI
jgi:hypothetical protein